MEVLLGTGAGRRLGSLLVLHLLVLKAAADCPKHQGGGHTVLNKKALLLNDFREGSNVTLECAHGYERESGSGVITCDDGRWTEPDLICRKKDCGPPKPKPHMHFNISGGTLVGATIRVFCDKGYQIQGSSFKECYAGGWSGRSQCQIATCDKPAQVANGNSDWTSPDYPKYGEVIHYVCNAGYTMFGNGSRTCSDEGEYDFPPPVCIETSTATDSSAAPTAHRDNTVTPSAAPAVPTVPTTLRGVRIPPTAEDEATTPGGVSTTASSSQHKHDAAEDTSRNIGYVPVIVSVICVTLVVCIAVLLLNRFLLKRKGSPTGTGPI